MAMTTVTAGAKQANFSDDNSMEIKDIFMYPNKLNSSLTDTISDELANVLNIYLTPMLILLGTIGNVASIVVFCNNKLRNQSTSQYLTALAVSDTVFLFQLIAPWLKVLHVSTVFSDYGFCQAFVYMSYVSSSHSAWLVVAFTVERFVAVVYPLRRSRMCTVRRARIVILLITAASLLVNLPVLRFAVPSIGDCNIDDDLIEHAARFNLVDTMFSFTLPLGIIIFLNVWIVIGVFKLSRDRGHLMREESARAAAVAAGRARAPRRALNTLQRQRSQQRITRMLLIVSTVFVVLNMPAYALRIMAYTKNMSSFEYSGKWAALQQISLLLFYANFGINFLLYCMTGQNFRRTLMLTFPCLRRRRWCEVCCLCCCCCAAADSELALRPSVTNSMSINTEGTSNNAAGAASLNREDMLSQQQRRTRRGPQYVRRWCFDNSRQHQRGIPNMSFELEDLSAHHALSHHYERPDPFEPNPTGPVRFGSPPTMTTPMILRPVPTRPQPQSYPGTLNIIERSNSEYWLSHSLQALPGENYALSQGQSSLGLLRNGLGPSPNETRPSRPVHEHSDIDCVMTPNESTDSPTAYVASAPSTSSNSTDSNSTGCNSTGSNSIVSGGTNSTARACIDPKPTCEESPPANNDSHPRARGSPTPDIRPNENSSEGICNELISYFPLEAQGHAPPYGTQVPAQESLTPHSGNSFLMSIREYLTSPHDEYYHLTEYDNILHEEIINREVQPLENLYSIDFNQPVETHGHLYDEQFNQPLSYYTLHQNDSLMVPQSTLPHFSGFNLPHWPSFPTLPAITNGIFPVGIGMDPVEGVGFVSFQENGNWWEPAGMALAEDQWRNHTFPPQRTARHQWRRRPDPYGRAAGAATRAHPPVRHY